MHINVVVADESHAKYADEICEEIFISARERGTGIARRTPEYIIEKMTAGKAVIAIAEDAVGIEVNEGRFRYQGADGKTNGQLTAADLNHTSLGSLGNLCNDAIKAKMNKAAEF